MNLPIAFTEHYMVRHVTLTGSLHPASPFNFRGEQTNSLAQVSYRFESLSNLNRPLRLSRVSENITSRSLPN